MSPADDRTSAGPNTPAALGYRMPAEWEPHRATWLSWPHNRASWPGKFEPVEPIMVQAVKALAEGELVRINVLDAEHEAHVRGLLRKADVTTNLQFHHFATNDAWCRDHGAIFVTRAGTGEAPLAAVDCEYNAWGGKYPPFDLDNAIPRQMAEVLGIPRFEADNRSYLSIAIGCTGGQHRSVYLVERIAASLGERFGNIVIRHRDLT